MADNLPEPSVLLADRGCHLTFDSNAEFIETVVETFARHAPRHHHLLFNHPFEDGRATEPDRHPCGCAEQWGLRSGPLSSWRKACGPAGPGLFDRHRQFDGSTAGALAKLAGKGVGARDL